MTEDFMSRYDAIAKKSDLPPYQGLNALFDLDGIPNDAKAPIKEVSKKIFERIEMFKKILLDMLQPEQILTMQEASFLDDADRDAIANILRQLMRLDRMLLLAELSNGEEEYRKFITTTSKAWPEIRDQIAPIFSKMERGWERPNNIKSMQSYIG